MKSRFFNKISIDRKNKTVKKTSLDKESLINQINWYINIPESIKKYTPKILEYDLNEPYILMEYIPYRKLENFFIKGKIDIIKYFMNKKLNEILDLFSKFKKELSYEDYVDMYYTKTIKRLNTLENYGIEKINKILKAKKITINGEEYDGIPKIKKEIKDQIKFLYSKEGTIIHGDLCFSNILFSKTKDDIKLIDPRGKFGSHIIYGDPKYDLAKLSHSINGKYEFIINDLYKLDDYNLTFPIEINYKFDEEVRLIESLLFLSMTPLHIDNINRVVAMLINGIKLFNVYRR